MSINHHLSHDNIGSGRSSRINSGSVGIGVDSFGSWIEYASSLSGEIISNRVSFIRPTSNKCRFLSPKHSYLSNWLRLILKSYMVHIFKMRHLKNSMSSGHLTNHSRTRHISIEMPHNHQFFTYLIKKGYCNEDLNSMDVKNISFLVLSLLLLCKGFRVWGTGMTKKNLLSNIIYYFDYIYLLYQVFK